MSAYVLSDGSDITTIQAFWLGVASGLAPWLFYSMTSRYVTFEIETNRRLYLDLLPPMAVLFPVVFSFAVRAAKGSVQCSLTQFGVGVLWLGVSMGLFASASTDHLAKFSNQDSTDAIYSLGGEVVFRDGIVFVNLDRAQLNADDVHTIATAVRKLRHVALSLTKASVSEEALSSLQGEAGIVSLNLNGTSLTDDSVRWLSTLPNLKHLNLTQTRVTRSGLNKIQRSVPAVEIIWGP